MSTFAALAITPDEAITRETKSRRTATSHGDAIELLASRFGRAISLVTRDGEIVDMITPTRPNSPHGFVPFAIARAPEDLIAFLFDRPLTHNNAITALALHSRAMTCLSLVLERGEVVDFVTPTPREFDLPLTVRIVNCLLKGQAQRSAA